MLIVGSCNIDLSAFVIYPPWHWRWKKRIAFLRWHTYVKWYSLAISIWRGQTRWRNGYYKRKGEISWQLKSWISYWGETRLSLKSGFKDVVCVWWKKRHRDIECKKTDGLITYVCLKPMFHILYWNICLFFIDIRDTYVWNKTRFQRLQNSVI